MVYSSDRRPKEKEKTILATEQLTVNSNVKTKDAVTIAPPAPPSVPAADPCLPCDFASFSFKGILDLTTLDVGSCLFTQYSIQDQIARIHNSTILKKQVWISFYGDSVLRNPLYFWNYGRFNGTLAHPQLETVFMCCTDIRNYETCSTSLHGAEAGDPAGIARIKFGEEGNTFCASWKLIKNPETGAREMESLLESTSGESGAAILPDLLSFNPGLWYFLEEGHSPQKYYKAMVKASKLMDVISRKGTIVVVNGVTAVEEAKLNKPMTNLEIMRLVSIVDHVLAPYPLIKRIHWFSSTLFAKFQATADGVHWGYFYHDQLYVSIQAHLNFLFRDDIGTSFCERVDS
ncbi:hypothetical protein HDU79_006530 [Rhizoclosmatium sp. JEL0117]|nr:hypothetical protein HDU79_006530 [Rhizoclosmatium sp. JEL0117]